MYIPTQLRYNLRLLEDRPKDLSELLSFAQCESFDPDILSPIVDVGARCVVPKDAWLVIETKPGTNDPSLVSVDATVIVQLYRE